MSLNITLTINPYYILHQSKNPPANTKCSLCTVLPLLLVFVERPHELLLVVPLLAGHVVPAGHHLVVALQTKVREDLTYNHTECLFHIKDTKM